MIFAFLRSKNLIVGDIFSNLVKSTISPSYEGKFKSTLRMTFLFMTKPLKKIFGYEGL